MALRLIIEDEEGATTIVPLGEEEVTIGREPGNTIQLTEQNVSRQHARLAQGPDGWVIEDLESYNGVKVNGVLVEGSVTLNEGDVVQIGDYHLALSNNVEQTTLNIDRPGQAANEPNRVMPSVDLPRISASEATAIATPSFVSGDGRGETHRGDEREGGGRGLWIGLGLAAVLGVGFLVFRMLGPGETPSKAGNDRGTQAAVGPADTKTPTKALTPDPSPPPSQPDPPPDPPQPDPSAGDVAPPDPTADGEDPEPEEPAKAIVLTPTPKPADTVKPKPIDKPRPKPDVPKGDPVALLEDARKASMANNSTQAYDLARKSYDIDRNGAALKLMGLSACKMGDQAKAKSAYRKLDASLQKQLKSVCQSNGIELE